MLSECPTTISAYFLAQKYNSVTLNKRTFEPDGGARRLCVAFVLKHSNREGRSTQHTLHTAESTYKAQYIPWWKMFNMVKKTQESCYMLENHFN